jgi:hypothetical protein
MTALTGGSLLFYAALAVPQTPNTGDTVRFPIGTADASMN